MVKINQYNILNVFIIISCPISYPYTFTFLSDSIRKDTVDENPIDENPDGNVATLTANGNDPAGKYITVFESYS